MVQIRPFLAPLHSSKFNIGLRQIIAIAGYYILVLNFKLSFVRVMANCLAKGLQDESKNHV